MKKKDYAEAASYLLSAFLILETSAMAVWGLFDMHRKFWTVSEWEWAGRSALFFVIFGILSSMVGFWIASFEDEDISVIVRVFLIFVTPIIAATVFCCAKSVGA